MRAGIAITLAAAALMVVEPAGAQAAEQCLFQGVEVTAQNVGQAERSLVCLTNLHRVRNGLAPLPIDTRLMTAARGHSADMQQRNFFSHTNPSGLGPTSRAMAAGYPFGVGENIAMNTEGTAASLIVQWKNSSGHNMNMLSANYRAIGVGMHRGCCPAGPDGVIGTQKFGLGQANTGDTGFDFYASSDKCAKAKMARLGILAKPKKKRTEKNRRALRRLNREIRKRCKPL
jgi:uncharacterized protein YkwD